MSCRIHTGRENQKEDRVAMSFYKEEKPELKLVSSNDESPSAQKTGWRSFLGRFFTSKRKPKAEPAKDPKRRPF